MRNVELYVLEGTLAFSAKGEKQAARAGDVGARGAPAPAPARGARRAGSLPRGAYARLVNAAARAVAVAGSVEGVAAAREAGTYLAIAVARGHASPEQLRRAGADTVVAELHEPL